MEGISSGPVGHSVHRVAQRSCVQGTIACSATTRFQGAVIVLRALAQGRPLSADEPLPSASNDWARKPPSGPSGKLGSWNSCEVVELRVQPDPFGGKYRRYALVVAAESGAVARADDRSVQRHRRLVGSCLASISSAQRSMRCLIGLSEKLLARKADDASPGNVQPDGGTHGRR